MPFNPTYKTVENEGCDLHYWYQGSGPLLMLIPGAGGVGRYYSSILEHLDHKFTVCAYDRRQNSLSKVHGELQMLNPAQHARDIIAIIKALNRQTASIFASSGGCIITFQMAISYPEYLDHVIAHEGPTTALLDDSTYHLNNTFKMHSIYKAKGALAAMEEFRSQFVGYEDTPVGTGTILEPEELVNFWENEFVMFTIYCPDLRKIVDNGVSIAVGAGRKSKDVFYARTTIPQAKILDCPRFLFTGHHTAFEEEPATVASEMIAAYEEMDKKKRLL